MKRILLLTLLSLFGASLNAMRDKTAEEERLFVEALYDDAGANAFADCFASNALDIDTMRAFNGYDVSIGEYLASDMGPHNTTVKKRIETLIYPQLQQYRSNPPEAESLRQYINNALRDSTYIPVLEQFLQKNCFNIDLIEDSFNSTLGGLVDWHMCSHYKFDALNALAILRLDKIKNFRTKKSSPLEELLIESRFDVSRYDAFKAEYEKNPVNVDEVATSKGIKMGEYIMAALQHGTDYTGALKIAELVQSHRTNTYESCGRLIGAYFDDETRFGDLQAWFEKFPCDFDVAAQPSQALFGKSLDEWVVDPTISADRRKKVLRVLELGRPHRAKDMKAFRELFKKYEQDSSKFVDLKKWFDEHPFDIDKVAYDNAKPQGETFGQRVNWLNKANLTTLFKANRSTPSVPHMHSWFTPKKMLCAALVIGAGYYYYRRNNQKSEQENKDVLSMPVVS